MENLYLVFVVVLFILAISDLVVGVGNDAVNFLNSAIGSKVASVKVITAVAALGILVGSTFSSGMMEVARSGVFHPGNFYFQEIMVIFMAVMITDILILDTFNTFGMPTSTTVSIIFELLGAAVALSFYKILTTTGNITEIGLYINSGKALAIISAILLSVGIAIFFGYIIQFISRFIFSFKYNKKLNIYGGLWGGIAVTSIVYFMLVKGAKGASFISPETLSFIKHNTPMLLLYSLIGLTVFFQLLIWIFKVNILKIIVFIGTFSLAMAFAGNDLVNFIGVPLAGLESFRTMAAHPELTPDTMTMESLLLPVKTPTGFLLIAGIIMVLTLFFSKKARTVTRTEVNLANQDVGRERFASNAFSRLTVGVTLQVVGNLRRIMPRRFIKHMDKQFNSSHFHKSVRHLPDPPAFDMLRASVNLFVASILIAFATSFKLPLSTTYVTFMVAMGTSLADRAWNRDSAVYRISGVITVIGGWFFTAFTAFTGAFLIALLINWGGLIAMGAALLFTLFIVFRSHLYHRRKEGIHSEQVEAMSSHAVSQENMITRCRHQIDHTLTEASAIFTGLNESLILEDRKLMKEWVSRVNVLNQQTKDQKDNIFHALKRLEEESGDSGHFYVQVIDYLREISHCLTYIARPLQEHLDNYHASLVGQQKEELMTLNLEVRHYIGMIHQVHTQRAFHRVPEVIDEQIRILAIIQKMKKKQIKLIKANEVGTKNTLMYMNLLAEAKNLMLFTVNMLKSERDFVVSLKE